MAKRRPSSTDIEQARELLRRAYASMDEFKKYGAEGGRTRAKKMTAVARRDAARRAAQARWAKRKTAKRS